MSPVEWLRGSAPPVRAPVEAGVGTYCDACGVGAPDVVVYDVRVRGEFEFTMCLKCRVRHGAEVLR